MIARSCVTAWPRLRRAEQNGKQCGGRSSSVTWHAAFPRSRNVNDTAQVFSGVIYTVTYRNVEQAAVM